MAGTAQAAVDSLLGHLSSALLEEAQLLRGVRSDVEFIKDEMEIMNSFLQDVARVARPSHQVQAWAKQVKELAYDSRICVDGYMHCLADAPRAPGGVAGALRRATRLLCTLLVRHRIATRIRELKARARDLGERRLRYDVSFPSVASRVPATTATGEVGEEEDDGRRRALANVTNLLDDDVREVISWLITKPPYDHPQRSLRVVTVVRSPYQEDEYSVAKKVYKHPYVSRCFDLKVWIDVGNGMYIPRRAMLQSIMKHLQVPLPSDAGYVEDKQLLKKLKEHLKGKKFLIVAANDPHGLVRKEIESVADGDHSISRSAIMVTTRFPPPCEPSAPYKVKNYLQIINLFCDRAVALVGDGCDIETKEILRKILMRRGWNFFSTEMFLRALYVNPNRSREELQNFLGGLTPPAIAAQMMRYCYKDLPRHYKSCLLYLFIPFQRMYEESSSPEDFKVRRTTIVRRWAAENLISKTDELDATDEAERCFDELLLRGLVRPVDIGAAGKVKSWTVHYRVLVFITRMAYEEGLIDGVTDLPLDLACRLSIRNGISLQQLQPLHDESKKKKMMKKKNKKDAQRFTNCWKSPMPMDSSEESKCAVKLDYTEAFLDSLPASHPLQLVEVLDLEGFKGLRRHHLRGICNKIIHLKYLSIRNTDVTELPKDIENLRYLETLDIRQTRIQTFTTKAIVLPKLVHLLAGHVEHQGSGAGRSFFTVHVPRGIGSMTDLKILCHVVVSNSADELIEVGRLQQLRKLGVVLRGKEILLSHFLRVIERLNESLRSLSVNFELGSRETPDLNMGKMAFSPPRLLESLNINGNITGLPTWIKDLRELVKITLSGTSLMDNAIRMLGELVSLRCLRLWHKSYIEIRLTLKDDEFQNLKYLLVEGSDVTNIHFGYRAAPKLEKIVWAFTKMETISGIKDLPRLKEIELNGDCEPYRIIEDMAEHPNHPVVIHNAICDAPN